MADDDIPKRMQDRPAKYFVAGKLFRNKATAIDWIKQGPGLATFSRMTNREFQVELRQSFADYEKTTNKQRRADENSKMLTCEMIVNAHPGKKRPTTMTRVIAAATAADNDPDCFRPRFMQIIKSNLFGSKAIGDSFGSALCKQLILKLTANNAYNCICYTAGEVKAYRNRVERIVRELNNEQQHVKINSGAVEIHEQEILTDKDIELKYIINGHYYDFGSYILSRYASEPTSRVLVAGGKPLQCLLACIHDQIKIGPKYAKILQSWNDTEITMSKMGQLCVDMGIKIRIYDCECNLWTSIGNPPKNHHRGTRVSVIVTNGHARNIVEKYRHRDDETMYTKPSYKTIEAFSPPGKYPENIHYGEFQFRNNRLIFDNSNAAPDSPNSIYYGDADFDAVIDHLVHREIFPAIMSSRSEIISISFTVNQHQNIELRNVAFRNDYLHVIPSQYNRTLNSCGMYLFRIWQKGADPDPEKFHLKEIPNVTTPIISAAFKQLCIPRVEMKQCDLQDVDAYIIDINKAYRSMCNNLGWFNGPPSIHKSEPIIAGRYIKPGIYYIDGFWHHHETLQYENQSFTPDYSILYDSIETHINDFADALYDGTIPYVGDNILEEHKKLMFNSLIGKFNPRPDEMSHSIVINDEADLSRVLLNGNKKIHWVRTFSSDNVPCLVNYSYTDVFTRGTNLPHLSAQIIQRCRLLIRKTRDALVKYYDANIIGTMTDSLVFCVPKGTVVDWDVVGVKFGNLPGEWKMERGNNILSLGVGRYGLYSVLQDGTKIEHVVKLQGSLKTSTLRSIDGLREIIARANLQQQREDHDISWWDPKNTATHRLMIGEAGVGKSRWICDNFRNKRGYLRLGPTGVSACSIRASTISSWFGLGPKNDHSVMTACATMQKARKSRLQSITTLIIDECYMVPLNMMERIDQLLRLICGDHRVFANKELIFVGDDRQLPSIETPFMGSLLYRSLDVTTEIIPYCAAARLSSEYRELVNYLREDRSCAELERFVENFPGLDKPTGDLDLSVYYRNSLVDAHNLRVLASMSGKRVMVGDMEFVEGCSVMLRGNESIKNGLYSGKICKFLGLSETGDVRVETEDMRLDGIMQMQQHELKKCDIALAHAITIHKSQSLTLPRINVYVSRGDLKNIDATRLLYVALTRVRDSSRVHLRLL